MVSLRMMAVQLFDVGLKRRKKDGRKGETFYVRRVSENPESGGINAENAG